MSKNLKIALVDDHEMFRSGIKFILGEKPEWKSSLLCAETIFLYP